MQTRARSTALVAVIFVLAALTSGCPKRPVTTVASVPAPTAPPPAAAPPAPAPPAPAPTPPAAAAPTPPPAPSPAPPPAPAAPTPPPPPAAAVTPAPTPPAPPSDYAPNPALKDIHFDFDKSNIRPADAKILDASAEYLRANREQLVLIEGHCDERGTAEYNLALGERRAKAAMTYLVGHGVEASRITIVSYGKERPVCTEKTEACWAANRRDRFLTKAR